MTTVLMSSMLGIWKLNDTARNSSQQPDHSRPNAPLDDVKPRMNTNKPEAKRSQPSMEATLVPILLALHHPRRLCIHPAFFRKGPSPLRRRNFERFMPAGRLTPIQELSQRRANDRRRPSFHQASRHRALT